MSQSLKQLSGILPGHRILLLPHCLRRSASCRASYDSNGLQCAACNPECPVNLLRTAALQNGYQGVCVAPGGSMAVNYVKEHRPQAIVAVACKKELEEGMQRVRALSGKFAPLIIVIPLIKDGCLDTQVDIDKAIEIISCGCLELAGNLVERNANNRR